MKLMITCGVLLLVVAVTRADYCTGDLVWNNTGSVCAPTCTAQYYPEKDMCPDGTVGRCTCPTGTLKLSDTSDTCVKPDDPRCTSLRFTDDPSNPFAFSEQPRDVTATVGEEVTLKCLVPSKYSIQYVWYKVQEYKVADAITKKNVYITGTNTIVFKKVKPEDAGYYQCKAIATPNFLMISDVSRVLVRHFTRSSDSIETEERVVKNNPLFELKCGEYSAYPPPSLRWVHNNDPINWDSSNYFMNKDKESRDYGTLYITNFKEEYAGTYTCTGTSPELDTVLQLAIRKVSITGSQNTVNSNPGVIESANHGSTVREGSTATLYCAGYGYPPPTIAWAKSVQLGETAPTLADCNDKMCVKEAGRMMVIYRTSGEDFTDYKCTVSNTIGRVERVLTLSQAPETYTINFLRISDPIRIQPNTYSSFTLSCVVDISKNANIYMSWRQNGEGLTNKEDRVETNTMTDPSQGKSTQQLVFKYPTGEDHGVYQCFVHNQENFKLTTTSVYVYANVEREPVQVDGEYASGMYDTNSAKEYKYFSQLKTAKEAHEACKEWNTAAKLVSILDYKENDVVFNLIMENKNSTNSSKAWIGLTDEVEEGIWRWVSGETSNKFSYWWKNKPDNSLGDRDYAYCDAAKSGHWLDAAGDERLPYVCKYYNATCTDLQNKDNLNFTFKEYSERPDPIRIAVFTEAQVECKGSSARLTCAPSGKWVPTSGQCSVITATTQQQDSSARGATFSSTIFSSTMLSLFLILQT